MLDKNAPLPLYFQLESQLREFIDSSEWQPGMRIPTEGELCEQYQVSRITVRRAITELVREGWLARYPGRGTFVAQPRFEQHITRLTGFTQDMELRGNQPSSRVLLFDQVTPPQAASRALHQEDGQMSILLKRLRLTNREPMAVETAYLSNRLCHRILGENFEDHSLYSMLNQKCSITAFRAMQTWQATACPREEARLLGISVGSPVLHIHRTTFNQDDQPFEWVESYYRGDKYVFQAELHAEFPIGDLKTAKS